MIEFDFTIAMNVVSKISKTQTITRDFGVVDQLGNPIGAYRSYPVSNYVITITHNDISRDFKYLNDTMQKETRRLPFTSMQLSMKPTTDNYYGSMGISGVAYSMSQFDMMVKYIQKFLNREFQCEVEL